MLYSCERSAAIIDPYQTTQKLCSLLAIEVLIQQRETLVNLVGDVFVAGGEEFDQFLSERAGLWYAKQAGTEIGNLAITA